MNVNETKISINLEGLDEIRKGLGENWYAKVGILGSSKNARAKFNQERIGGEELTNVELGVIHEFGSAEHGIPARSFLRMPIETQKDEIMKFLSSAKVKEMIEQGRIKSVFQWLGLVGEGIVQRAFTTRGYGKWKPNAPYTIAQKGSSAPLIDTGQLRRSITSEAAKRENT